MPKATGAVSEPRCWKITINPEECPKGAWEVCRSAGLAMLGLPGEHGEANYAVRNLKQLRVGDWLVAYTPQEGTYTVGGVGRVTRGYRCEEAPFDHPWNGPVRRSVAIDWHTGACCIADLVKEGLFRKGKIPRVLDEITPEEFAYIRDRVFVAGAAAEWSEGQSPADEGDGRPQAAACGISALATSGRGPTAPDGSHPPPASRPSPMVLDPWQEQPPLPQFFVEWAAEDHVLGPDEPAGIALLPPAEAPRREARARKPSETGLPKSLAEAAAAMRQSRETHLLASFGGQDARVDGLDFGLPMPGEEALPVSGARWEAGPDLTAEPSEVRVGALGWTGLFRREVESGRRCALLLRGPQYSFLNMTPAGTALRGLPLFALFAIGAVAAPGKEAFRSGAQFIFRGRRASGDYEVEVQPRRSMPVFREPMEAQ